MIRAVALFALVAATGACKDSRPSPKKGVEVTPLEPAGPAMPSTRVQARDILGKPEAEARSAFGATGDTRTIDDVALDLVIDNGVAVELGVRMPNARARRDDIAGWLGLGKQYWFTLGDTRYSVDTHADDHVRIVDEDRAMRLDPNYPARVRQTFAEIMAEGASLTTGLNVTATATGEGNHVLRLNLPVCDTVILQKLQADPTMLEQLRRADFRRIECSNGNAQAAVELAGPAVLRREFAAEFQQSFAAAGQADVRVTATGADATVIQVHWGACTAEALTALIGNVKPLLVQHGFTRVECAGSATPGSVDL